MENPDIMLEILNPEINALIQNVEQFGCYNQKADLETMDFSNIQTDIAKHAPLWNIIIRDLMTGQYVDASNQDHQARLTKRLYMITSIVTHSRAKKQSNYFQKANGFYLHGSGIKQRSLGFLATLGICSAPTTIIRGNKEIAAAEEV